MHILILNWRDPKHPAAGGAEVYVYEVARAWVGSGHDVTHFSAAVPGLPATATTDGIRMVRAGSRLGVYRAARDFVQGQEGKFDLILDVVNTRPFHAPRFAGRTPVLALIFQLASEVWNYETPFPMSVVGRWWLEPKWLREYRTTRVITISDSSKESLAGRGLKDISVVPVGLTVQPPRPATTREPRPTAIFVGRLVPNKRPADAIAAVQLARRRIPDLTLWIVGTGPLDAKLRRISGREVEFLGRVGDREKFELLARAHALLATSVREGWGMNVSEAAAVGTRSIGYDVAGLRDSITAGGGLLVPSTPAAMAEGIVEKLPVWKDENVHNLATGTRSWTEVAETILQHAPECARGALSRGQKADPSGAG